MKNGNSNLAVAVLHNDAAERSILGTILEYGGGAMEAVTQRITASMFYQPQHAAIYSIMTYLYWGGAEIDLSSVSLGYSKTREGAANIGLVLSLLEYKSTATLQSNIQEIEELYKRRKIRELALKLSDIGVSREQGVEEAVEEAVEGIKKLDDNPDTNIASFAEVLQDVQRAVKANQTGGIKHGLMTGFSSIDNRGGFQLSDLVIIAADSSQGKTSFAIDIAVNAAKTGVPIAVYSMEMRQTQLAARALSQGAEVNSRLILNERLNSGELERIDRSIAELRNLPIYFDDNSTTSINKVYSSLRTLKRRKGVKMAIIDYLQILSTNQRVANLETFYGEVARNLKNLAKELDMCIVLLSQLSRSYDNPEPNLSRLRGSGQINEAADMTFLLYRPEIYGKQYSGAYRNTDTKGTALIQCAKGRNVGIYSFVCNFDAEHTHFYDRTTMDRAYMEEQQRRKEE